VHYFYKTEKEFENMRDNDQLLEHALFVGNLYGTPRFYVESKIAEGKNVVLEIEVNGALQVRDKYPGCVLIFLVPPTFTELKRRLLERGTKDAETLKERMVRAREELLLIDKYDYLVINDEVPKAVECIRTIAATERLRPSRFLNLSETFFEGDIYA
jgi:guanylate kinase